MGTNTQLKKYYPKLQNRVESRGKITKFINNLWAGTEVISLKASGKRRLRLCSKQSLLRPLFGRSFSHPLIGTCTTLCRPLDRGFESSLFQNMDVPSLRAVIHLSSFPFLLVYPTFLVLLSLPNYLLTLFSSRLVFPVTLLYFPLLLPLLTAHPAGLIGKRNLNYFQI